MRVFGGRGRIDVREERPRPHRAPAPLGRTGRRQPLVAFERLGKDGPWVARQRGQRDGLGRGTSTDLCALGRIRGLEHEGPRHRGKRQVERHVDEDREDEQPPVPHIADSNPPGAPWGKAVAGGALVVQTPCTTPRPRAQPRLAVVG